ncbi:MAG: tetratricopeptide repeat protein [Stappiaceae bacterium]
MPKDRYDNVLSTDSPAARDAYIEGIDRFLSYEKGIGEAFDRAVEADENFALGYAALSRHWLMQGDMKKSHDFMEEARGRVEGTTEREKAHIGVLGMILDGDAANARRAIRAHLDEFPRDALVAQTCTGVFGLIGFSGLPGREAEQLAFTSKLLPHYGEDWWFLGQHAFAQVETGQIDQAEATVERSLEGNPRNANSAHIRSHVYYENGATEAGYTFLEEWQRDYDKSGVLHCHVAWHIALWALERGDIETMWRVIDEDVAPGGAWGPALNVLTDVAAILYRAELAGVAVAPERWKMVSDYAIKYFPEPGIAFGDIHAALAHAMAGNNEALEKIISDATGPAAEMVKICARAFQAVALEQWSTATAHLVQIMNDHARFGGSRAQRDLIEYALLGTLLKQGRGQEAQMLISTRRPVQAAAHPVAGL